MGKNSGYAARLSASRGPHTTRLRPGTGSRRRLMYAAAPLTKMRDMRGMDHEPWTLDDAVWRGQRVIGCKVVNALRSRVRRFESCRGHPW